MIKKTWPLALLLGLTLACSSSKEGPAAKREIDEAHVKTLRKVAKDCETGAYRSRELCPEWRFHESRLRRQGHAFDLTRPVAIKRIDAALSLLEDDDVWARRIARGLLAMGLPLVNQESTHQRMLDQLLEQLKKGDEETRLDVMGLVDDFLDKQHQPLLEEMTKVESKAVRAMGWRAISRCIKRGCEIAPEEIIKRYEAEQEPVVRAGLMLLAGRAELSRVYDWCAGWERPLEGPCRNILLERDTPQAHALLKARAEKLLKEKVYGPASHALADLGRTSLARSEWLALVEIFLDDPKTPLKLRQLVARTLVLGKDAPEVLAFAEARLERVRSDPALAPLKLDWTRVIDALKRKEHKHGAGDDHGHGSRDLHKEHESHKAHKAPQGQKGNPKAKDPHAGHGHDDHAGHGH